MAKPVPVEGLDPEMPLEEAAGRLLPPLIADAFARELAVRSGDPELGVHDMRVAVKRLREVFRLLRPAFARKRFRRHRGWIEELNDALGEVRERDVLVAHIAGAAGEERTAPAIASLLEAQLTHRDIAFHELVGTLDRLHDRALRPRLESAVAEAAARREAGDLGSFVRREIAAHLERVRRRWRRVRGAATERALHDTRIANKRLRYAIEPFRSFLPEEVSRAYQAASRFHDALGALHDADVLLGAARTALLGAPPADRAPLARLLARAAAERCELLGEVAERADALEGGGWELLARAVASGPGPDPVAREAEPRVPPPPSRTRGGDAAGGA